MLKPAVITRNLHKWLGLLVGLQVMLWMASGLYMVVVDIDFIHGDTLVKNMPPVITVPKEPRITIADLAQRYPGASRMGLRSVMGKVFYTVTDAGSRYLFDADTGSLASPLNADTAREIAEHHYAGEARVSRVSLITTNPPAEIQTRVLPLWRVDFDDRYATSFYIDPFDGSLVTRRHRYWRIFDFMWMLHIMDYENRQDAHNPLLITAQISGLLFAISGLWLLIYSFASSSRSKTRTSR